MICATAGTSQEIPLLFGWVTCRHELPPLSSRQGSNGQYSPSLCISSPGGWTSNWVVKKHLASKIIGQIVMLHQPRFPLKIRGSQASPSKKLPFWGAQGSVRSWDFNRPPLLLRPPSPDIFPPNPSTHPGSTTLVFSKKKKQHPWLSDLAKIPIFFQS